MYTTIIGSLILTVTAFFVFGWSSSEEQQTSELIEYVQNGINNQNFEKRDYIGEEWSDGKVLVVIDNDYTDDGFKDVARVYVDNVRVDLKEFESDKIVELFHYYKDFKNEIIQNKVREKIKKLNED